MKYFIPVVLFLVYILTAFYFINAFIKEGIIVTISTTIAVISFCFALYNFLKALENENVTFIDNELSEFHRRVENFKLSDRNLDYRKSVNEIREIVIKFDEPERIANTTLYNLDNELYKIFIHLYNCTKKIKKLNNNNNLHYTNKLNNIIHDCGIVDAYKKSEITEIQESKCQPVLEKLNNFYIKNLNIN